MGSKWENNIRNIHEIRSRLEKIRAIFLISHCFRLCWKVSTLSPFYSSQLRDLLRPESASVRKKGERLCSFTNPGFQKSYYVLRVFLMPSVLMRMFITLIFLHVLAFFIDLSFCLSFFLLYKYVDSYINTCIYPHINLQNTNWRFRSSQSSTSPPTFPLPDTMVRGISWTLVVTKSVYKFFVNYGIRNLSTTFKITCHCNVSSAIRFYPLLTVFLCTVNPLHILFSFSVHIYTSPKIVFSLHAFHLKFRMNTSTWRISYLCTVTKHT